MHDCRNTSQTIQGRSLRAFLYGFLGICSVVLLGVIFFTTSYHVGLALSKTDKEIPYQHSIDYIHDAQMYMDMMLWDDAFYIAKEYLSHNIDGANRWIAWNILVDASLATNKAQDAMSFLDDMQYEFSGQHVYEHAIALKKAPVLELLHRYDEAIALYAYLEKEHYESIPNSKQSTKYLLTTEQQGDIQYRMAKLFMHEQNYSGAEEKLRACMSFTELDINHRVQCAYDLAQVQSLTNREYEAQELLRQLWNVEDLPQILRAGIGYLLADILERREKKAQARAMFQAVRPIYPNVGVIDMRLKLLK